MKPLKLDDRNPQATEWFRVKHAHGVTEAAVDSYDEAVAMVRAVYGADVQIGHSGDIPDGGERTLCWIGDVPEDDAGARACCEIRKSHGTVIE